MNEIVAQWIAKADGDLIVAQRELRARKQRNPDVAAFLAQQCVEKYLKAFLVHHRRRFPWTHDCAKLLDLTLPLMPLWAAQREACENISEYAVAIRYPGENATIEHARAAVAFASVMRAAVCDALHIPTGPEKRARIRRRRKPKRKR